MVIKKSLVFMVFFVIRIGRDTKKYGLHGGIVACADLSPTLDSVFGFMGKS